MRSSLTHGPFLLSFLLVPHGGLAAADEDVARLKARVEQLEAENKALRAEVVRLKDELYKVPGGKSDEARLATDLRLLAYLDKALGEKPNDLGVRPDAAALATRFHEGRLAFLFRFTLDPAADPGAIDLRITDVPPGFNSRTRAEFIKGVYKVDRASLTLCLGPMDDPDGRPRAFSGSAGRLYVFERDRE